MRYFTKAISLMLVICMMTGSVAISTYASENTETYDKVPLFFQNDYPNTPYRDGTVASDGCSIACLAMVATYLTDKPYYPDAVAETFQALEGTNLERMESASSVLGLPDYKKFYTWANVLDSLSKGEVVIVLVNYESVFTDSQHFIVLTGMTDAGKILVNDPYKPNYEKEELKAGFEKGFSHSDISAGFDGAWSYVKPNQAGKKPDPIPNNPVTPSPEPISKPIPENTEPIVETVRPAPVFNEVPLYYQNDYPDVRYGSGTIATCGCSMTSLAMVASFLTKHEYLPPDLVRFFKEFNGNHIQRLEYGSDLLQLPWTKAGNCYDAFNALQEGKIVIALMNQNSIFTEGQHFIVLTGLNEDGKILVNDSNKNNYGVWNLKKGFENGFDQADIQRGYSGAWIYDVDAMPDDPFIYVEPIVESTIDKSKTRYPEISLTSAEMDLLASIIWLEARGETFEGQQAVAEVIFNRMVSDDFPNTLNGVIFAEGQFPSTYFLDTAEPLSMQYDAIESALYGPNVLPLDVVFYATYAINDHIWGKIGGHIFCYKYYGVE